MKAIWQAALDYLTTREHSALELEQKLSAKGYTDAEIALTLTQLQAKNLQSDKRFSEAFIRARVNKGKGELLIRKQLKARGITSPDFSKVDFYTLANQVRVKKFGKNPPKNLTEKAKQMRFLQARGFSFEEIKQCF